MLPTLVLRFAEGGLHHGRFVVHPSQRVRMGRVPPNDFIVDDVRMSRRHAWFFFEDGQWMVEDAGSTSGVHVDECSIGASGRGPLVPGKQVRVGGVRFHVELGPPDDPPTVPLGSPTQADGK